MDRRIDRHPVTVADILCESTNQVAALAGVQLGRQSQLILPRYLGVLTLLRCLGRVPQRRSVLRPLRAFRHDDERILNPAPSRVVVHQAVALVSATPAPAVAQYTLNVRDADIRAFIQDAARITGRTFVIDGRVNGKVSVVTDRPLSRSEYFEIFLATLRSNGLVAVPGPNGSYRIQPIDRKSTRLNSSH